MIVFTVTDNLTSNVYVGSARDSVEEQWAKLIVMAEENGAGDLSEAIRSSGAENFTLETYDYAETPTEARELVRDAAESLGATVIRTGKLQQASVKTGSSKKLDTAKSESADTSSSTSQNPAALKSAEDIKKDVAAFLAARNLNKDQNSDHAKEENNDSATRSELGSGRPSSLNDTARQRSLDSKLSGNKIIATPRSGEPKSPNIRASKSKVVENRSKQKEHGPVTQIDVAAYLANHKKEASEPKKEATVALRKTDSTKEADDMKAVMMRIEMKRRQNRTTATPTKAKKKPSSQQVQKATENLLKIAGAQNSKTNNSRKEKLPDGRVSSSAKEKRIKEAIAQERMEREAAQAAKVAAEAKEMAELMARLDQKTKEKERIRRRR